MLSVLLKILSHASAKKKTKMFKGLKFRTFVKSIYWLFSSDIMTVKGLIFFSRSCLYSRASFAKLHGAADAGIFYIRFVSVGSITLGSK